MNNIIITGTKFPAGYVRTKRHSVKADEVKDFIASNNIRLHSNVILNGDLAEFFEFTPTLGA